MGLTVLDTGVLISFLDSDDAHHEQARNSIAEAMSRNDRLVIPGSVLAEVLVGPFRRGPAAVQVVLDLIARLPLEVAPLDERVAVAASKVRAGHPRVKLPDAVVIGTADVVEATELITTDRGWPTAATAHIQAKLTIL
ncbi:MAG: PIN domain-containing protein [Acidimicrobiia bacterium]|nr:PIN domain-containing protein [Acidimicrobiia bacterium]